MSSSEPTPRQRAGAIIRDLPRFLWAMRPQWIWRVGGEPWIYMRNRDERLVSSGRGVACNWRWTSDLHAARVFPELGRVLMRRALRDWPIEFREDPVDVRTEPQVSFIIGHRGVARLPLLQATLKSIAAQRGVGLECIVVEQAPFPQIRDSLPDWVYYVHTPPPDSSLPYCRSWALNVGATLARGRLLVLHDNDMLIPQDYAEELMQRFRTGYEVINLKRFVFYLDPESSERICGSNQVKADRAPEAVVQNLEAGGSVAIARRAYVEIGGFDESFVGWGGEDNEFWERACTRRVWPYGYLPLVHLWHEPQPEKGLGEITPPKQRYWEASKRPPEERIRMLAGLPSGDPAGPVEAAWGR